MPLAPARLAQGAAAGVAAAAVWAAAEPVLRRISGTPFSDTRLLSGLVERWRPALGAGYPLGLGLHLVNGAAFGAAFVALGGHGWRQGILAAQVENLVLWPAMLVADRQHPDRRAGRWPPLAGSPRVLGQEVAAHALFGAILGALTPARRGR
jgi:hypothetical protein